MEIKKNWNRILGLIVVAILAFWGINNISVLQTGISTIISVFIPFIIGAALAYILNLPINLMEKGLEKWQKEDKKWFRPVTILLSFALVSLLIFALLFLVLPDLQATVSSFISVVPQAANSVVTYISDFLNEHPEVIQFIQEMNLDMDSIQQRLISFAQTFASGTLNGAVGIISTTISSVVNVFIAIIFAIYILMKKETLVRQVKKTVYGIWSLPMANYLVNVGRKANDIFSSFIGGQTMEAIILGVLVYLGMWLFDFPYRLSISVITGALALIPIYGAILGGLVGFILISVVSFPKAIWFIIFIVIIQQIEGNIIYPRVVGNSVGLPGIWVMMTVTVGGALFGLVGMLVSVPIVSLVYTLVSEQINYNLNRRNLEVGTESNNLRRNNIRTHLNK